MYTYSYNYNNLEVYSLSVCLCNEGGILNVAHIIFVILRNFIIFIDSLWAVLNIICMEFTKHCVNYQQMLHLRKLG